jgi:hypothetical protein
MSGSQGRAAEQTDRIVYRTLTQSYNSIRVLIESHLVFSI